MIRHALSSAFRWLANSFTKNMAMKIGAVVFAVLLWSYVVTFNNPERVRTLYDVPVTYVGAEELHDRGLTPSRPLYDALNTVNITVTVRSEYMAGTTSDLMQASVDLTGITQPGEYTLPVRSTTQANFISISSTTPSNVTITIEDSVEKQVPVEVQLEGTQNPELYYGLPRLSQSTIEISGARSSIEQVARAVCTVDVNGLDQTVTATHTLHLVNQDGEEISSNLFADVPSVIVEVPVYPKRTVTIDPERVKDQITGVADGYEITDVVIDPAEIDIAGPSEVIERVQTISLEPVDLQGAQQNTTVSDVPVILPDGVFAALPPSVDVQITLEVVESQKNYAGVAVSTKNLDEGLEAVLQPSAVNVEVSGAATAVADVTANEVLPFVDLTGLGPGEHHVTVMFENEADLGVKLSSSSRTIRVEIRETQLQPSQRPDS